MIFVILGDAHVAEVAHLVTEDILGFPENRAVLNLSEVTSLEAFESRNLLVDSLVVFSYLLFNIADEGMRSLASVSEESIEGSKVLREIRALNDFFAVFYHLRVN